MSAASAIHHLATAILRHGSTATVFFRALFGSVVAGPNVPGSTVILTTSNNASSGMDGFPTKQANLERVAIRVEQLAECYGSVYVSAELYQHPRCDAALMPSRVIVVDNAPLDLACSSRVCISLSSKHAYFLLDHDTPAGQLRDLSRRAAYTVDGDRGGWDSQQLVHISGTYNTKAKHGGRYVATLQREEWRQGDCVHLSPQ